MSIPVIDTLKPLGKFAIAEGKDIDVSGKRVNEIVEDYENRISALEAGGGGEGTTNYNVLENKPSINGVELKGNKLAAELGLAKTTDIPTKISQLANDSGYSTFSGAYEDLTGKPAIPAGKADIGLGNVDNTSDINKPISTAVQAEITRIDGIDRDFENRITALEESGGGGGTTNYTDLSNKPKINGVELNGNRTTADLKINIPTKLSQLQNDADFMVEGDVPEWAKQPTKPTYTKTEVGLSNVDNTSDMNKPISTATKAALDEKANTSTLTSVINRVSAVESDQAALNSRMNTFTHLEEGSTTGDAELIDIRTGYNGIQYDSAGSAVREQATGIKRNAEYYTDISLAELFDGKHYIKKSDVVQGVISNTTGAYTKGTDTKLCATIDFMPIEKGKTYTFSTGGTVKFNVYYYDEDKNFMAAQYTNAGLKADSFTLANTEYSYIKVGCYATSNVQELYNNYFKCTTPSSKDTFASIKAEVNKSKMATIQTLNDVNFDTAAKTVSFGAASFVFCGGNQVDISSTTHDISEFMSGQFVYFDPVTASFTKTKTDNWFIGAYWANVNKVDWNIRPDKININGVNLYSSMYANTFKNAVFDVLIGANIDTESKTMTFSTGSFISCGNTRKTLPTEPIDISAFTSGQFVYFEPSTMTFTATKSSTTWYVGAFWANYYGLDWDIDKSKVTVDGMPICCSSRFVGKTVNCLGDSMTYGSGTTKAYHQWFKQLINCKTVNNYGVAGSCISPKKEEHPSWEEGIGSFLERYSDMGEADVITVFGGVNDWVTGKTLGTINDTTDDTFYGSMKLLCAGLIAKYPTGRIYFFFSPQTDYVHRPANFNADSPWKGNTEGKSKKGNTLAEFSNAMKEVCAMYGIPFKDLYSNSWYGLSGVLGDNAGTSGVYGSDCLHPNAEGHKVLALKMASFINAN